MFAVFEPVNSHNREKLGPPVLLTQIKTNKTWPISNIFQYFQDSATTILRRLIGRPLLLVQPKEEERSRRRRPFMSHHPPFQVSISSTFYKRLFCTKVLCARFSLITARFVTFWQKEIGENSRCKFYQQFTCSFYSCRSQKRNNSVKLLVFFCAFSIYGCKSFE